MAFTLEMLLKVRAVMQNNEIPPRVVKTRKEAREFTARDPVGHEWRIGDKYYLIAKKNGWWALAP